MLGLNQRGSTLADTAEKFKAFLGMLALRSAPASGGTQPCVGQPTWRASACIQARN